MNVTRHLKWHNVDELMEYLDAHPESKLKQLWHWIRNSCKWEDEFPYESPTTKFLVYMCKCGKVNTKAMRKLPSRLVDMANGKN